MSSNDPFNTTTALSPGVSFVVPVYRGAGTLLELVRRIHDVMTVNGFDGEVILVDDDSPDESWQVIESLGRQYDWVRGYRLMRNYGQHNALLCGIRQARFEWTVTIDDDLQNPPEEVTLLLERMKEGVDVVYGTPVTESHGFLRDLASVVTKITLQSVMGVDNARSVSAFRAFRTVLRDAFSRYRSPFVSIDVLLTWGTSRFSSVPVRQVNRRDGVSNYTFGKLFRHAMNMMTGFSVLPLQLAVWVGFSFTAFGFLVLVFVIGRWIIHGSVVQGFPFLASIVAIFSGAQLFTLGIFGEYLSRMHFRIMERPAYSVRSESVNQP